jgi:hypothetical protein
MEIICGVMSCSEMPSFVLTSSCVYEMWKSLFSGLRVLGLMESAGSDFEELAGLADLEDLEGLELA